ncbi:hypothetical protein [Adhaeribacter terreus]|uniref:SCP2 domain-containing protein n=1 Tax=Adhaeribacter terreus TaxID=529703 RepID=A0ABW0ECL2_9BACT
MKIAIEELLEALDNAAAKTLGRQQLNLKYAGLNLKDSQDKAILKLSGNTLIIEPQILQVHEANVDMKITIRQRSFSGEVSGVLTAQLSFIRMPISSFLPEEIAENIAVFTTLSLN